MIRNILFNDRYKRLLSEPGFQDFIKEWNGLLRPYMPVGYNQVVTGSVLEDVFHLAESTLPTVGEEGALASSYGFQDDDSVGDSLGDSVGDSLGEDEYQGQGDAPNESERMKSLVSALAKLRISNPGTYVALQKLVAERNGIFR